MDGTTLFDLKRLRKDLKDLVDFDAGESNVPVLAAIYEIIEKHYVNKSTNYLYQLASAGNIYGEKLHKKGTVTYRELCEQKKETLTYLVFNFLQNITGRLVTKDMFQKYSACDTVDQFSQLFNRLPPANAAILGSLVIHLARIVNISENLTALKMSRKFDILVDSHVRHAVEGFIQKLIELELKTPGVMMYLMIPKTNPQNTGEEGETYDNVGDGNNHHDQQESQSHIRITQPTAPLSDTSLGRHFRGGTSQGSYPGGGRSQGRQPEVHGMGTRSRGGAMRGQTSSLDTNTDYGARTGKYGTQTTYDQSKYTTETTDIGNNEETMPHVHNLQHEVDTEAFPLKEDKRVLEDENKELKEQIESWMRGCDQLRTKYNKLKDSHKELEKDNHQLVIDLESVNADVSRLTHNLQESHESNEKKRREVSRLENEMAGLERESSGKQKKIDELERKMEKIITKNDNTSQIQSGEVSTLKTAKATLERRNDKLLARIKTLETENTTLTQSIETERENVQLEQSTIATNQKIIEDLEVKNNELEGKISDHINEYDQISKQLNDSESMCEKRKTAIDNLRTQKKNADQEHNSSMEQMVKKHQEEVAQQKNDMEKDKEKTVAKIRKTFSEKVSRYGTDCMNLAEEIRTGTCISSHSSQNGYQNQVSRGNSDLERQNELLVAQLTEKENEIKRYKSQKPEQRNTSTNANGAQNKKYGCKSCSYRTHDGYELQKHMLACTGY